jgi:hypothetical protein
MVLSRMMLVMLVLLVAGALPVERSLAESGVKAGPPHPFSAVRLVARAGGAIEARGEFNELGTLTMIAGYGPSQAKSWRVGCHVSTVGKARCPRLKPSREAGRSLKRRGRLKVYVSATFTAASGAFTELFPRSTMLRA